MLHKDLSQRPQFDIPRESNACPTPKDTRSQTHVDEGTTRLHALTSWYKQALQHPMPLAAPSSHPSLHLHSSTNRLRSLPPFYSSI